MSSTSAEVFRRFVRSVFAAQAAVLRHGDAANARFGQTSARWRVLLHVSLGQTSVADIARSTGYSRQAVQRLANALIAEGDLQSLPDPADRRRRALVLTPAGARVLRRMESSFDSWSARLLERLPRKELEALADQLDRASSVVLEDCNRLETQATGSAHESCRYADDNEKGARNA